MTNQLFIVVGVVAGVVVGVVARVITRVGVELHLRLWKLNAIDDGNLYLHLHAMLRCFSSPGVATPSDGALRRHPRTMTALRTQSSVEDAGGERGIVCVMSMGGCGRSATPLIQTSGSEAGDGPRLSRFPVRTTT